MGKTGKETTRRNSFVLHIWWEKGEAGSVWRGWAQHAVSGDSRHFQTIAELLHFHRNRRRYQRQRASK